MKQPAWESGEHAAVRKILAESMVRLERAGAEFFACPDNTAHLALEAEGPELALPDVRIAEVVADPRPVQAINGWGSWERSTP